MNHKKINKINGIQFVSISPLTTGVESKVGGSGADTFSGFVDAASGANTTLNSGDNLDGGTGSDALNISITGTAGTTSVVGVTLANIERIQTQNTSTAGQTVDLATSTGYTTLATYGSNQAVTYGNAASLANAEMSYGSSNLTVNFNAATVAGAADSATLTLKGQSGGTFTTSGVETLTVNATGASSGSATTQTTVTDTGLKTVNITGDKNVGLIFSDTTVTKVDGSAATGNLFVNAGNAIGAQNVSLTTGAGNDTITIDGANGSDTIDGGAGNDTVVFTAASGSTALTKVTNVETIGASISGVGGAVTVDTSIIAGVTGYTASLTDTKSSAADGTTDLTLSKIADSAAVTVTTATATGATGGLAAMGANNGTTLTVTPATDTLTNVFALTLSGIGNQDTNASAVLGLNTVTADLFETINVTSNANSTGTSTSNLIASLASTNAKTLNVTGAANFEVTAITAGNLATIDASAATGNSYIDAGGAKSTAVITAGAGNDTIDGGTGANSITGGAGNDLLAGGGGNDTISGGDGNDRIVDGSLSANGTTETLNGTASVLNFNGGAGDDTFVVNITTLGSTDTITGGDGTDTLIVNQTAGAGAALSLTGASTDALKNVTVEKIQLKGAAATDVITLSVNDAGLTQMGGSLTVTAISATGGSQAVDASGVLAGSGTVTLDGSGSTNAGSITYTGGGATDVVIGSTSNDTVTFNNGVYLTASDSLSGGTGTDTLVISSANASTVIASQLANVKSFETINLDGVTAAATTAMSLTLSDAVAVANADSSTNTLTVQRINAAAAIDDTGTTKIDGTAVTSVALNLSGALGADTLIGGAGNDTLTGGTGIDSLTGGDGNDLFVYTANSDVTVGEVINGGNGTDTIRVSGANLNIDFTAATITNVEVIDVIGSTGTGRTAAFNFSQLSTTTQITESTDVATAANEYAVVINASAGTNDLSGFTFDTNRTNGVQVNNTGANKALSVSITGTSKADSITGGDNADTITGGNGADTIDGGAGNDTINLTESTSASDVIKFTAAIGATNVDQIIGFNAGTNATTVDQLQFSVGGNTFTNGGGATIAAGATVSVTTAAGAANTAFGANDEVVFYQYAAGGYASTAALQTAIQTNNSRLTFTDPTATKNILLAYLNSADGYIHIATAAVVNTATSTALATVTEVATLVGVTAFTNLDAGDFAFIA